MTALSILIVGCGNIAGGFDERRDSGDYPLTHAGAFSRDSRFEMAACVEPDVHRRSEFMKAWKIQKGFGTFAEVLSSGERFDVICICSPTTSHYSDIETALQLKPMLIFCEKPVTTSLSETERLVGLCNKSSIPLVVNYTRRWDPDVVTLQADIINGNWGQLRSISGYYSKGILNNGSHMLDLLRFIVGEMAIVKVGIPVQDYFEDDPTIPVWLESDQGVPIHLGCGNARDYAFFELQLVFSHGVLSMEDGGMFWRERRVVDSDTFQGYRMLDEGGRRPGKYSRSMTHAVENIYRAISQGAVIASTGESALEAQRLCEKIKSLADVSG